MPVPPLPTTAAPEPRLVDASIARVLAVAAGTTALVTVLSYFAPRRYAATLVGLAFLAVTWALVLRRDEGVVRAHGLSLGGLLEPARLELRRLLGDAGAALAWVALLAIVVFPLFWMGFRVYWHARTFTMPPPRSLLDDVAGQLVVIALPEEAFYRGYLQTSLDAAWPPRWRILGAELGPGWLVAAAIFAIGHLCTIPSAGRLAVFFPGLVFGWLRARTRGVGAPVVFHAACNLLSATLSRGYGVG